MNLVAAMPVPDTGMMRMVMAATIAPQILVDLAVFGLRHVGFPRPCPSPAATRPKHKENTRNHCERDDAQSYPAFDQHPALHISRLNLSYRGAVE
jgi:hypothetical protein